MIPQSVNVVFPTDKRQPSKTYKLDISSRRIVGMTSGIDAVRQAIEKIILTERYAYLIYDWNYGIGIEKYIGKDFAMIQADIKNTVGTALQVDDRILTVNEVSIKKIGIDSLYIQYSVSSTEGEVTGLVQVAGGEKNSL